MEAMVVKIIGILQRSRLHLHHPHQKLEYEKGTVYNFNRITCIMTDEGVQTDRKRKMPVKKRRELMMKRRRVNAHEISGMRPAKGVTRTERTTETQRQYSCSSNSAAAEKEVERTGSVLVKFLAVTLENIRQATCNKTVDNIISVLHNDGFNIKLFKEEVKTAKDFTAINKEIVSKCMEK